MRPEDLFLAIGSVEEARLARSEFFASSDDKQEDKTMKKKPTRMLRNLLVAVLIVSMLSVTAYAVAGFLIFGSPEEMVSAIFGNETGFDHSDGSIQPDPYGSPEGIIVEPTFDRVEADEAVVAEDIVPFVDVVGRSVSSAGYTLTVDAVMYDSATSCGFVTYLLENAGGVSGYRLQSNGELWYEGKPDPVQINHYGKSYIIQEKTTDTCLVATCYFQCIKQVGDKLVISLPSEEEPMSDEEINDIIVRLDREIRKKLTPDQAVEKAKEVIGDAYFESDSEVPDGADMTQQEWDVERAYTILRSRWYHAEFEQKGPSITISLVEKYLDHVTAADGAVLITPVSFQLDISNKDNDWEFRTVDGFPLVSQLIICFEDGTEYVVRDVYIDKTEYARTDNTIFSVIGSASEGIEDTQNRYCCMFNRVIDVDDIEAVILEGNRIPVQ